MQRVLPGHHVGANAERRIGEHVGQVREVFVEAEVWFSDVKIANLIGHLDRSPGPLAVKGAEGVGGAAEVPVVPVVEQLGLAQADDVMTVWQMTN